MSLYSPRHGERREREEGGREGGEREESHIVFGMQVYTHIIENAHMYVCMYSG